MLALLGPNGAGKTTTVRILTTLTRPDAGHADHRRVRRTPSSRPRSAGVISLTGQSAAVDENQTGRENLVMVGRLMHLGRPAARRRTGELLEQFGLTDAMDRRVKTYSGGMRRRLDLAMSLIARPRVIFLDEPTTGLDPASRSTMWDTIGELVRRRDHDPADHAVPGGGGPAGRPDRAARPRPDRCHRHRRRTEVADRR